MIKSYIDNYSGDLVNGAGIRIVIKEIDYENAFAFFFSPPDLLPIYQPWCGEKRTIDMLAKI